MATEKDFELLDDYLGNRLNGAERQTFEQRMEADPDLKNEFSFQQKLIKGVQAARKAELKQLLNNTPVPAFNTAETSTLTKVALGTLVAAVVATGLYFYFNTDPVAQVSQTTSEQTVTTPAPPAKQDAVALTEPATTQEVEKESAATTQNPTVKQNKPRANQQPAEQPVIEVFDPSAESEEINTGEKDASGRTGKLRNATSSMAVEVDKTNRKYSFHYQFKDGKLFLYGPFEENLYEILEFFNQEKRTMFLYYKDGYYLLNEGTDSIQSLSPIKDEALIKKLKESRGN